MDLIAAGLPDFEQRIAIAAACCDVSRTRVLLGGQADVGAVGDRARGPQRVKRVDQMIHLLVGVHRRRREAHALGAPRHGRVVDRLHVDAVVAQQDVRHRLAVRSDRRP